MARTIYIVGDLAFYARVNAEKEANKLDKKVKTATLADSLSSDEYQLQTQQQVKEELCEAFLSIPGLESCTWAQYTDYFNDGDATNFHVHSDNVGVNGIGRYDVEVGCGYKYKMVKGEYEKVPTSKGPTKEYVIAERVKEALNKYEDDMLESAFGDHVCVIATKKGDKIEFTTEYCSHD